MKWLNVILIISLLANVAIMSYHWYRMNQILGAIKEIRYMATTVGTTVSGLSGLDNYLNILTGLAAFSKNIPFEKLKFWG